MELTSGTRLGPYEIQAALGAGGMGQVYRARDTRLQRTVAIKALHELSAQQADRTARFEREAQILASLNHPNIAAIHGIEQVDGASYLILEFVDGRTLPEVLRAGPLPLDEALVVARQIADALAAAHERGIIHRDLKPGNVMLTADGQVKVLDFGLGKSLDAEASRASEAERPSAHSPTMTLAATQAGMILGTAGYMSPEQAKGRPADRRSDVWAFGCVLYELLTGKRAFDGEDVTETLAAIVRGEPDWNALPATLPPAIRTLLERCVVKDPRQRLADMSVVRFLLHEPALLAPTHTVVTPAAPKRRSLGLPIAAGLVALAALATFGVTRWAGPTATPAVAARAVHASLVLPEGDEVTSLGQIPLAISPDGAFVTYVGRRDGTSQLFLRPLAEREPRLLAGTEGAKSPFFSPDSRWIAFFAEGELKKVTVGGTGLQSLAVARDARGGCWASDNTIYYAPDNTSGLWRVAASGGEAFELTLPDRAQGEISHHWPHALPDGQGLLFTIWTGPGRDERHIVRQALPSGERHVLVRGGATPRYVGDGYLLYGRLDGLFAVPWHPDDLDVGDAVPIALPQSPRLEYEGGSDYAVSDEGTLVYVAGGATRLAQRVVWVDRTGKTESLPLPEREYESVALSPDGRRAVVQLQEGVVGLWMYDFARQTLTPFSTTGGSSQAPVWSVDGQRVIYRGTRNGVRNVFWRSADGTGDEERLTTKDDVIQTPTSVSPDGRWLVFIEGGPQSQVGTSLWGLSLGPDRLPRTIVGGGAVSGEVSRDGRWIAYESITDRRSEIFVQPFPGPGPRQQISKSGGQSPLWSHDGRELYYSTPGSLMVVDVTTGAAFSAGTPRVLFEGRYRTSVNGKTPYDVARDDRRFLRVEQARPERPVTRIDVTLNWLADLRRAADEGR